jgi:hypothetical protein
MRRLPYWITACERGQRMLLSSHFCRLVGLFDFCTYKSPNGHAGGIDLDQSGAAN